MARQPTATTPDGPLTDDTSQPCLDTLRHRALDGDERALADLFEDLRVRFLAIAKRRVQPDHVEDVVHEALGVVLSKYGALPRDRNILLWSLTVLRNVIGNHYQSRRRDHDRTVQVEDWRTVPAASLATDPMADLAGGESAELLQQAITDLARRSPRCGTIFAHILGSVEAGGGPREISQRALELVQRELPDMSRNTFYVALHRCRAQLRGLLDRMEAAHG
jgi:DNA-directed RNA polymerase specialized sigma24 family protein